MTDEHAVAVPDPTPTAAAGWYVRGHQQQWWDGANWTEHFAPLAQAAQAVPVVVVGTHKTSHGFHLIMSIITLGLWIPVWIIVGIYNSGRR